MSGKETYNINFGRLNTGKHHYSFRIGAAFFAQFDYSIIKECNTETEVTINKTRLNLMNFNFKIDGTLNLACDRCLDILPYPIKAEYALVVKLQEMDEEQDEVDDEIVFLNPGQYEIDISKYIYDFHTLSIPFKKECQNASAKCAEIDKLIDGVKEDKDNLSEGNDPRWDDLKKLLN